MSTGKEVRMARIMGRDGKALVVAMDHAAIAGSMGALAEPEQIIRTVVAGEPDALLLTRGMLRHGRAAIQPEVGVILRITGGFTVLSGRDFHDRVISTVEEALRWGADGVAVTVKFGHESEGEFIQAASAVADSCDHWGMPLMVEAMLVPRGGSRFPEGEGLTIAARAAAELGADLIKTALPKDGAGFRELTAGCPVPVLALGGERKDEGKVLAMAKQAMQAGAAGLVMGRSVWLAEDPRAMVKQLRRVVHS